MDTVAPLMPEPWNPDYEKFKKEFEKYLVNDQTILIGHSGGTTFLVHWLGESKQRIARLILVAPWKVSDNEKEADKPFYDYSIDETIKDRVGEIIMFTSNNEEEDGKRSVVIFQKAIGGEVISLPGRGHYVFSDMKTEEFPELLEQILR
jgi:predicted alpha/beta hydrolase family esterase